jgi:hypothetical protein
VRAAFGGVLIFIVALILTCCTNGQYLQLSGKGPLPDASGTPTNSPSVGVLANPFDTGIAAKELTVSVSDQINYTWTSTGADLIQSQVTIDPADNCINGPRVGPVPWYASTVPDSGTGTAHDQILTCMGEGLPSPTPDNPYPTRTYTITVFAQNSTSGLTASDQLVLHVSRLNE